MKLINTIIVKRIINKYKQDMGNYFDFVQGNEEDIYNDALVIVEKAPLQYKIRMLLRGEVK
jgi:hypothetical protein